MAMIYVKSKEGRKLFYEGRIIPQDKFIPVTNDPFIRRLIDHWGDLEEQGSTKKPVTPPKATLKPADPSPPRATAVAAQPTGAQAPGTGAPKPGN